jgi:hypothetical protein
VSPPVTSKSLSLSELLISGLQCPKVGLMSGLQCAKVGPMSGLGALVAAAVSGKIALMLNEDFRGVRAITRGCSGPSILTMLTCERRGEIILHPLCSKSSHYTNNSTVPTSRNYKLTFICTVAQCIYHIQLIFHSNYLTHVTVTKLYFEVSLYSFLRRKLYEV